MREKIANKATTDTPINLASSDIDSLRLHLQNCQCCLDEVERTLRDESTDARLLPEQKESEFIPTEVTGRLIPIDAEPPPIEDEAS